MKRLGSWLALAALLAATLAGALTFDRRAWPGLVGDEATYLMQAQSLAWDHDLRYTRADYDRFVAQWGRQPEGLILQSDDGGATLQYGKPPSYAFYLAPFLRLAPLRGVAIANALLLALIALATARALRETLGPAAPLWVAVWLFASVAFASFTWAHADLFLMALAAVALSLVYGLPEGGGGTPGVRRTALHGLAAGVLVGLLAASRPFYGALLLPLLFAFPVGPKGSRRAGVAGLALGATLVLLPALVSMARGGPWSPEYGGQRQSFDSSTGFPASDSAEGAWKEAIAARGNHSWKPEQVTFERRQSAWNALYFLAGRHVGVLPYFLPLLLGFSAFGLGKGERWERGRWLLPLTVLAASACFLIVRPFNFYGGGGSIANRYFLPLYPALWFLAAKRPRREVFRPLLAALLAAPFLWPLWCHPRAFLLDAQGGYSYVSAAARRLLPYETTLSHLKPAGKDDFVHGSLWAKPLTTSLEAEEGGARIHLGSPGSAGTSGVAGTKAQNEGELLIGSPAPLTGVEIETLPPASAPVAAAGGGVEEKGAAGGFRTEVRFNRPRAVHRMWWTDDYYYLYRLDLRLPPGALEREGGASFTLRPLSPPSPPAP